MYFLGSIWINATVREHSAYHGGTETGQTVADHIIADCQHSNDNRVWRVHCTHRPEPGDDREVCADGVVLADNVFWRHGHVDDTLDAGQRDLPERVRLLLYLRYYLIFIISR